MLTYIHKRYFLSNLPSLRDHLKYIYLENHVISINSSKNVGPQSSAGLGKKLK